MTTTEPTEAERRSWDACVKVSELINNSCVENDGAGAYVYKTTIESCEGVEEPHIVAFVDVEEEGEDAVWEVHQNYGLNVYTSDLKIDAEPQKVAEWVKSVIKTIETGK